MKRIVVLFHRRDRRRQVPPAATRPGDGQRGKRVAMIHHLSRAWRQKGLDVTYVYGTRDRPKADLVIPHVDLTRIPPEYIEYLRAYPNVLNRNVADVSKRRVSRHLLTEDDDYRGPVIVKTDNNCRGTPERRMDNLVHPSLRCLRRAARRIWGERGRDLARTKTLDRYPVYPSLADVPREVFGNPALVVERFLPEEEGGRYFVRYYVFLGDRSKNIRLAGSDRILKADNTVRVDDSQPVPDELVEARRLFGLDYGKMDYTVHHGAVTLLDVNPTPSAPGPAATEVAVAALSDGILSLLDRG